MKKSVLFTSVLCGTLAASPVMAEGVSSEFHALSAMSSSVPAMTAAQMASVEGGILSLFPIVVDTAFQCHGSCTFVQHSSGQFLDVDALDLGGLLGAIGGLLGGL